MFKIKPSMRQPLVSGFSGNWNIDLPHINISGTFY
jgi:hypothetical protein